MKKLYVLRKKNNFLIIEPQEASWVVLDRDAFKELQNSPIFQELSKKNSQQLKYLLSVLYEKNVNIEPNLKGIAQKLSWDPSCSLPNVPHYFVLEVSSTCNLRCKYCEAASTLQKGLMDFETMKVIVDKILALPFQYPATFLFHGGEPLLNFPTIKKTLPYIKTRAKNKKIIFSVQTNGTLLNQEMIDFFRKYKVRMGVSIDGPEEIHNKSRIYPSSKGSFKDALKAINLLNKNNFPNFGIISVITNPKDIKYFYPFLVKNKVKGARLNYYYRQGRGKAKIMSDKIQEEFAKEHLKLFEKILDHNKDSPFKINLLNISLMLGNLLSKKRNYMCMRAPCGAGNSTLSIKVNGDIYPCDRMKNKKEFLIGNIKEKKTLEEILANSPILKKLKSRVPENIRKCRTCPLRNFCLAGCTNNSYIHFGSLFRESDFCQYYRRIIESLMWLSFERKNETRAYLSKYAKNQFTS